MIIIRIAEIEYKLLLLRKVEAKWLLLVTWSHIMAWKKNDFDSK